ncbi:MAG: hypothetical protein ACWA5U_06910 [bacterium]
MMKLFQIIPLFSILLVILLFLSMIGVFPEHLNNELRVFGHSLTITLPSSATWTMDWGTVWIIIGVVVLYFELMKSTHTSDTTSAEHALSALVFVIYLGLWLTQPWANNDVFMILTGMSYVDVVAGFTITIAAARRDLTL